MVGKIGNSIKKIHTGHVKSWYKIWCYSKLNKLSKCCKFILGYFYRAVFKAATAAMFLSPVKQGAFVMFFVFLVACLILLVTCPFMVVYRFFELLEIKTERLTKRLRKEEIERLCLVDVLIKVLDKLIKDCSLNLDNNDENKSLVEHIRLLRSELIDMRLTIISESKKN